MTKGNYPVVVRTAVVLKVAHLPNDAQVLFFAAFPIQTDQTGNCTHIPNLAPKEL
jgi:hypothetical protein